MPRDTGTKKTSTGKVEIDASIETAEVVGGGLKIGESSDATKQTIRWNDTSKKYEYHNGTTWVEFGGTSGSSEVYSSFASTPTDTYTELFGGLVTAPSYTSFASDTTEVFGFDMEAQP
jgi:hypothetical protein